MSYSDDYYHERDIDTEMPEREIFNPCENPPSERVED